MNKTKKLRNQAEDWMVFELQSDRPFYQDSAGCFNATKLAEECANALNLFIDEIHYDIPDYVYDVACDVVEMFESN